MPRKKDPQQVIKDAMGEYQKRIAIGPVAAIEKAFEAIKPLQGSVEVGLEGFKFIVAALVTEFPDDGYDQWMRGGTKWMEMEERIKKYWSDQTGSGL